LALIKCGECGGAVSTKANSCPHCGAKKRHFKRQPGSAVRIFKFVGGFFVVLFVFQALGITDSGDQTTPISDTSTYTLHSRSDFNVEGDQSVPDAWACQASTAHVLGIALDQVEIYNPGSPATVRIKTPEGQTREITCKVRGNKILLKRDGDTDWVDGFADFRFARNNSEFLSEIHYLEKDKTEYKVYFFNDFPNLPAEVGSSSRLLKEKSSDTSVSVRDEQVCKAAIATMFRKSPSTINVENSSSPYVLSYVRKPDNSTWKYRCKVQGNEIIWAGWINGSWGRWRDDQNDAEVTYKVDGDQIQISEQYPGSSASTKSYDISSL